MRRACFVTTAALLLLLQSRTADAFLARFPPEVSVEVIANTLEGSPRVQCEASEEIRTRGRTEWWVTVAKTKPHPQFGWEAVGREILCAEDSPEHTRLDSGDPLAPYLIANLSMSTRIVPQMEDEKLLSVQVSLALQTLSGFDEGGRPIYAETQVKRKLVFSESREVFVPLLIATGAEREALGLHEVFVRVAASTTNAQSAADYGTISVISGASGAEILLDGGVTGSISTDGETVLRSVRPGLREVGVRDSVGHETRKAIRVVADRTVLVDLSSPEPTPDWAPFRLVPLGRNEEGYESFRRQSDGATVVRIPAGELLMGNEETERSPLEHRVYVSEFLMDRTGVTWGQFKRFAAASGIPLPLHEPYWEIRTDHPAVYVTWEEAKAYCEWVGGRLPTEAEREKAARGTDGRMYPWGDEEPDPERAVFRRSWGKEATSPVGTHPSGASPYGLWDMAGNVWEWCSDWYDRDYYEVSPYRDPQGPASGLAHVVRGGSWDSRPSVLSASCRSWGHRGYRDGDFGFRCAMNAPK